MVCVTTPHAPLDRFLSTFRPVLHIAFAVLLGFSLVQALLSSTTPVVTAVTLVTAALTAVYLTGTVWENRFHNGATSQDPRRWTLSWLAAVLVLWTVLVVLSAEFVWLLFPLIFIILAVTPPVTGAVTLTLGWAVASFVPLLTGQRAGIAGVIGPGFGVLFAALAFWAYRALSREAAHHRQVAEQLRSTQDRLLAAENQAGRLAERERLSREIHDTLAQGFSSVVLLSRAARTAIDQGRTDTTRDQLTVITDTAQENLDQARELVRATSANAGAGTDTSTDIGSGGGGTGSTASQEAVTSGELPAALRHLTDEFSRRQRALGSGIEITVDVDGVAALPAAVAAALLRVAQESLTNAVTHAGATHVHLTLGTWPTETVLDVFDNGHGFDPDSVRPTADGGYGLSGMRQRIDELGGTVRVMSTSSGTVVTAHVPVPDLPTGPAGGTGTVGAAGQTTSER